MDLESYVRSLFTDDNGEVLLSPKQNGFILNTESYPRRYSENSNSISNQPLEVREYKKNHPSHRHHHHRNHRPKSGSLQTNETQTSIDGEFKEMSLQQQQQQLPPHQHFPQLDMGTAQLTTRIQQETSSNNTQTVPQNNHTAAVNQELHFDPARSSSSSDYLSPHTKPERLSTKSRNKKAPMSHMVDMVTAPMHGKHQSSRTSYQGEPFSRDSTGLASHPLLNDRPEDEPPPYTELLTDTSSPGTTKTRSKKAESKEQASSPVRSRDTREVRLTRMESFQGFGFHLQYNKSYYLAQHIKANSPAEQAGLHAKDVILSINQEKTDGMSHTNFVQIVNSNSTLTFAVQSLEDYLCAHPPRARKQPSAAAVSPQLQRQASSGSTSRERAAAHNRTVMSSQYEDEPPPYTERLTDTSSPGSTKTRSEKAESKKQASSPVRSRDTREVRLTRMENFQGFGLHLQYNKSYYLVQRIEANSPAEQAGLHINDVILSINQEKTDGMSHGNFIEIVNSNSTSTFVVQALKDYLRAHPSRTRKQPSTTVVPAVATIGLK